MSKTSNVRATMLATLMAIPLAGAVAIVLPVEALAQAAQREGGWRKEVADKAQAAQKAGQAGNYGEAIRLLKEAKAKGSLSPQEEQGVNELLLWAASAAKDHRLVLQTLDERIATGRVSGADLTKKLRLKATTHYSLRDYKNAAATYEKLRAQGALNADDMTVLANAQMAMKDYRSAIPTLEQAIAAQQKAGRTAKLGPLLSMLNSAYFETGNDAKRMQTLERLMAVAPSERVFKQIASAFEVQSNRDPVVMINIYRLGASRNLLSSDHYAKYAESALDLASPGEAVAMLERGMSSGAIKKDDRNSRLLADAKSQLERVKASLAQQEAEAKAIATGEPEAKLATAYFTLKNYSKAAEAAKRGVSKGNVRRPDGLNMLLGISLANSKKASEAKNAFKAAAASNQQIKGVADLWSSLTG
jgi:hypothetical protein